MAKRIKWITNGVKFTRGNYQPLIAKFDNSKKWLEVAAMITASGFKSEIRELAQEFGAQVVEIKPMWDEMDNPTEDRMDVVGFLKLSTGYWFRIEKDVPEGAKREFIEFEPEEIFA